MDAKQSGRRTCLIERALERRTYHHRRSGLGRDVVAECAALPARQCDHADGGGGPLVEVGPVLDDDRRHTFILIVVVGILKLAFSVAVDLALDLLVSERVGQRSVLVPVDCAQGMGCSPVSRCVCEL